MQLRVCVNVFGVELVVDAVHHSHQSQCSYSSSDEHTQLIIVLHHVNICQCETNTQVTGQESFTFIYHRKEQHLYYSMFL